MTDRERDVCKWIADLMYVVVGKGMNEGAHHDYRTTNRVDDQDNPYGLFKHIEPPTPAEIREASIDGVSKYLLPLIKIRLEQVCEDYERYE